MNQCMPWEVPNSPEDSSSTSLTYECQICKFFIPHHLIRTHAKMHQAGYSQANNVEDIFIPVIKIEEEQNDVVFEGQIFAKPLPPYPHSVPYSNKPAQITRPPPPYQIPQSYATTSGYSTTTSNTHSEPITNCGYTNNHNSTSNFMYDSDGFQDECGSYSSGNSSPQLGQPGQNMFTSDENLSDYQREYTTDYNYFREEIPRQEPEYTNVRSFCKIEKVSIATNRDETFGPGQDYHQPPESPQYYQDQRVSVSGDTETPRINSVWSKQPSTMCDLCGKKFESTVSLVFHANKFHKISIQANHVCKICHLSYKSKGGLSRHMTCKHGTKSMKK